MGITYYNKKIKKTSTASEYIPVYYFCKGFLFRFSTSSSFANPNISETSLNKNMFSCIVVA